MHLIRLGRLYLSQFHRPSGAACWTDDPENALPLSCEAFARWVLAQLATLGIDAADAEIVWE